MKKTAPPPTEAVVQIDKFRQAARELETDDREEAFDEKLKRVARQPAPQGPADKA